MNYRINPRDLISPLREKYPQRLSFAPLKALTFDSRFMTRNAVGFHRKGETVQEISSNTKKFRNN